MATVNVLSKQIYQEIARVSSLIEGISPRGRKMIEFRLSRLKRLEDLISEDKFCCFDGLAEAYHLRTELLAEIYDIVRENAH